MLYCCITGILSLLLATLDRVWLNPDNLVLFSVELSTALILFGIAIAIDEIKDK